MADLGNLAALITAFNARIADNNTNAISEEDVRQSLIDLADTIFSQVGRVQGPTYTFSTTTTMANPGAHTFRLNNATMGSVTNAAFSTTATFGSADRSIETWMYDWGLSILLKNVANDDLIYFVLNAPSASGSPYFNWVVSLLTTNIGGVTDATPANGTVWQVVHVGTGSINANVQTAIEAGDALKLSITAASALPDTLTVSGTAGGVADGDYARGLGEDAYSPANDLTYPQWLKVGGAGTDDAINYDGIFVGGALYAYQEVGSVMPWRISPADWLLAADDSPNAATVGVGGTPVLDPQAVDVGVSNTTGLGTAAGTTGANGTYPKVSDTLWAIVGGAGTAADGIEWDGVDTYDLKVGNVAKYEGTGGTLAGGPQSATWAAVGGAGTVPTVTQGYSTPQALLDRLEEEKADVADLPLRYKFTGDGGAATGTIGVNTFPMAVTVTNPGAGLYHFTAASGTPFTTGKTYVNVALFTNSPLAWRLEALGDTEIRIGIFDTTDGSAADPTTYLIAIETEP